MAKQQAKATVVQDCSTCTSHIKHKNKIHCKLRQKTRNEFTPYSEVFKQDCTFFKQHLISKGI